MLRESLLQLVAASSAVTVLEPFLTPVTLPLVPLPLALSTEGLLERQLMLRPAGVTVAVTVLVLPTHTADGAAVILTSIFSPLQLPPLQTSLSVHLSLSSQGVLSATLVCLQAPSSQVSLVH